MRAPDSKGGVVLADVQLDRPARDKLSKALAILDPPPAHRESWRKKVHSVLAMQQMLAAKDEPESDRNGLARYIAALRKVQAIHAARQEPSLLRASAIDSEIAEAEWTLATQPRRPGGRPPDKATKLAVEWTRLVLEMCACEPTTERKGKWHRLAQLWADTDRDLRRHLEESLVATLAQNP
jgi:hypothetical protein